mgnify:CR=1 FL=1
MAEDFTSSLRTLSHLASLIRLRFVEPLNGLFPAIVESVHGRRGGVKHGSVKAFHGVQKRDVEAHDAEADDADTIPISLLIIRLSRKSSDFTGDITAKNPTQRGIITNLDLSKRLL